VPATTDVTPSDLVMVNVARAPRVSVSLALTVEASDADAVAVFDIVPVADDGMVAVTV